MTEFIDASEPVIALVGMLLPQELCDDVSRLQVLVADGEVRDYPEELRPLIEFLCQPRLQSEVLVRLSTINAPDSALDDLVEGRYVVRVLPGETDASLRGFQDIRVIAIGVPVPELSGNGLVFVGSSETDLNRSLPVSELLATVLSEADEAEDFPSAVRRIGADLGLTEGRVVRSALFGLGALLGSGLARLEWIDPS